MKRCINVIGSLVGLVLFSPVMAAAAVLVFIRMGRPVLFRQVRTGLNEEPFTLYKLRTMAGTRGPDGRLLPDGERLTPLGRALRRWSVDELPQLWNVLRGEMSLVGPRPLLPELLDAYTPRQARRHEVKPGLVGWAGVTGRNDQSWVEKFEKDVWYVENRSLVLDLWIVIRAVFVVLGGRGVSRAGHPTASPVTDLDTSRCCYARPGTLSGPGGAGRKGPGSANSLSEGREEGPA